jgi:hypothetical protein
MWREVLVDLVLQKEQGERDGKAQKGKPRATYLLPGASSKITQEAEECMKFSTPHGHGWRDGFTTVGLLLITLAC